MPRTIIWAADGSESAARALPHATALLEGEGALLIAVHIAVEGSPGAPDGEVPDVRAPNFVEEAQSLVTDLAERGIRAALRVVNFPGMQPAQSIADIATEVGADMIVVGTRGHSPVGGVLVGSVTQRLLEVAPCPVLAVPPAAAAPETRSGEATTIEAGAAAGA